jgi:hypothetical protein
VTEYQLIKEKICNHIKMLKSQILHANISHIISYSLKLKIQVLAQLWHSLVVILGYVFSSKSLYPMVTSHGHEHLTLLLVDK